MPTNPLSEVSAPILVEICELMGAAVVKVDPRGLEVSPLGRRGEALLEAAEAPHSAFWSTTVPQGDLDAVLAALRTVADGGQARTIEHRLQVGSALRVFRTAIRRTGPELLVALLDVTTSHHNERQWGELEAWLATLGDTLPFDFWICDVTDRCVLQNPTSVRRLGTLFGKRCSDALAPQVSREHWQLAFARALSGELVREPLEYEVGGVQRVFSRVVAPVRMGSTISGVLGFDLDVTELRQAQESLLRHRQLAELGEMAAVVAHEVRNPLGCMSNALALLRRKAKLDDESLSLGQIIDDEIQRLDLLVASLLDFARPVKTKLERRSLAELVDDALSQTMRNHGGRVRLNRSVAPAIEPLLMDARLLNMAFTNLFRNAVQAMAADGDLEVEISLEAAADPQWVRVRVTDSGPGIPAQVKDRLFEPFVTTRPTGTGLGLTIVRRAIEAHQGHLDLHSEPGKGTTFTVRLPLRSAQ